MSRSYKKNPVYTDGRAGSTKKSKKFANKKVRSYNEEESLSGSDYKKVYGQYNIHDYILRWTLEEALEYYRNHPEQYKEYTTEEEFKHYWYKITKMK